MMSSVAYGRRLSATKSIFLVAIMLLSVQSYVGFASASSAGDLAFTEQVSPIEDRWYSAYQPIELSVVVENQGVTTPSEPRLFKWYVCEGDVNVGWCKSNWNSPTIEGDRGTMQISGITPGTSQIVQASDNWNPGGTEGTFTVIFSFDITDNDPSDDNLRYLINVTRDFVDVEINDQWDPRSELQNLRSDENGVVLNTNTPYSFRAKGDVFICGGCQTNISFGWRLLNFSGGVISESSSVYTNLPAWGGWSEFGRLMPDFSHNQEGTFTLQMGVTASNGSPSGDLNDFNDLYSFDFTINDDVDLQIESMVPSHNQFASDYYYGEDMVTAVIRNLGYRAVNNTVISFEVSDAQGESINESSCTIPVLYPNASQTCTFDLLFTGNSRTIRVSAPTNFLDGASDSSISNNIITEVSDIVAGSINANIQQSNAQGIYYSGDNIVMSTRVSETAAFPLNYSWYAAGIVQIGYGPELNISGSVLGLGDHTISVYVRDALGDISAVHEEITIFDQVDVDASPLFTSTAIAREDSYFQWSYELPHQGKDYTVGGGKTPLAILEFELLGTEDNSADIGMDWMEIDLNLSALLPANVDHETVDLKIMNTTNDTLWFNLQAPTFVTLNGDTLEIHAEQNIVFLVIGELPKAEVYAENFTSTRRADGHIELSWDNVGDINNQYFTGWQLYKIESEEGTSTYFPDPNSTSEAVLEALTLGTNITVVEKTESGFFDPDALETGTCASYAIVPMDRGNNPDFNRMNVTRPNGEAGLFCGDAVAPTTEPISFSHELSYDNTTECYEYRLDWSYCYEVTLTWTWPDHEANGNLTWNLYRMEARPSSTNVDLLTPIIAGMQATPGEEFNVTRTGKMNDGIRPQRTYYYILTPVDSVGNEQTIVNYPSQSIERVQVEDVFWDYNQHLIPPPPVEPEPPLGSDWLGDLFDGLSNDSRVQVSAGVSFGLLLFGLLFILPLIWNKHKVLKKVIAARIKNQSRNMQLDDDFDDFFD